MVVDVHVHYVHCKVLEKMTVNSPIATIYSIDEDCISFHYYGRILVFSRKKKLFVNYFCMKPV